MSTVLQFADESRRVRCSASNSEVATAVIEARPTGGADTTSASSASRIRPGRTFERSTRCRAALYACAGGAGEWWPHLPDSGTLMERDKGVASWKEEGLTLG